MNRNLGLDLLRGVCALGIVFYHYATWQFIEKNGHNAPLYESIGRFGVYVFFALSALVLSMLYKVHFSSSISKTMLLSFYQRRAVRILPLLALTATLMFLYKGIISEFSFTLFTRYVFTATGLFSLGVPGLLSSVSVAWSLGIEILFYLIFPVMGLVIFSLSNKRKIIVLFTFVILDLIYLHFLYKGYRSDSLQYWRYFMTIFTFVPFFLIGFIVYSSKIKESYKPKLFVMAVALFGLIFIWSEIVELKIDQDIFKPLNFCILTLLVYALVYSCWHMELPQFTHSLARFLGEISYSLYLTHWITYLPIKHGITSYSFTSYLTLSIVLAYILNRFFEIPIKKILLNKVTV